MAEKKLLRYCGYYYDEETGFYYVSSRYYDPEIGRFINADILISTGQGILGYNMFAYCRNNPICRRDISGTADVEIFDDDPDLLDEDKVFAGGKTGGKSGLLGKGFAGGHKGGSKAINPSAQIKGNSYDINKLQKTQPYTYPDVVSGMKETIVQNGPNSLSPIEIRVHHGQALVVDGHHRLEAFSQLGYDRVPIKYLHSSQLGKNLPDGSYYRSIEELLEAAEICN